MNLFNILIDDPLNQSILKVPTVLKSKQNNHNLILVFSISLYLAVNIILTIFNII